MDANNSLQKALEEFSEQISPLAITQLESVILPAKKTRLGHGLAITIGLTAAACSPDALQQIVGVAIEKLKDAIKANSLVGFQLIVGTEVEGRAQRVFRISVPLERFDEISELATLPQKTGEILSGVEIVWYDSPRI